MAAAEATRRAAQRADARAPADAGRRAHTLA